MYGCVPLFNLQITMVMYPGKTWTCVATPKTLKLPHLHSAGPWKGRVAFGNIKNWPYSYYFSNLSNFNFNTKMFKHVNTHIYSNKGLPASSGTVQLTCCHVLQMDRSDIEDDPEEGEINNERENERENEESAMNANPLSQLDFYQADPFAHCQSDRMYQIWSLCHYQADDTLNNTIQCRFVSSFILNCSGKMFWFEV